MSLSFVYTALAVLATIFLIQKLFVTVVSEEKVDGVIIDTGCVILLSVCFICLWLPQHVLSPLIIGICIGTLYTTYAAYWELKRNRK